jgi:hypothetical protein
MSMQLKHNHPLSVLNARYLFSDKVQQFPLQDQFWKKIGEGLPQFDHEYW